MDRMRRHWLWRLRHARERARPVDMLLRELRSQWLTTIAVEGPRQAANEAAEVLSERTGCSREEGRKAVARAWKVLGLSDANDSARV